MNDDDTGRYSGSDRDYRASGLLPADEYSLQREKFAGLSTVAKSQAETKDFYGNTQTWLIETHRLPEGTYVGFLQRIVQGVHGPEALRLVLPPTVMRALLRHEDTLVNKARSRAAKRAADTRKARGIEPAFLKGRKKTKAK